MEKSLKKYSRKELLELLLKVTESNEALIAENDELRRGATVRVSQSAKIGSIAEAALKANGYFEAVQNAADEYLREVKQLRDQMIARNEELLLAQRTQPDLVKEMHSQQKALERIQEQARTYIQDVQTYANNVMARANAQAEAIVADAQARAQASLTDAQTQARTMSTDTQVIMADARNRADALLADAQSQAQAIVAQANNEAKRMLAQANDEAQRILSQADGQAKALIQNAEGASTGTPAAMQSTREPSVVAPLSPINPDATGHIPLRGRHAKTLATN